MKLPRQQAWLFGKTQINMHLKLISYTSTQQYSLNAPPTVFWIMSPTSKMSEVKAFQMLTVSCTSNKCCLSDKWQKHCCLCFVLFFLTQLRIPENCSCSFIYACCPCCPFLNHSGINTEYSKRSSGANSNWGGKKKIRGWKVNREENVELLFPEFKSNTTKVWQQSETDKHFS